MIDWIARPRRRRSPRSTRCTSSRTRACRRDFARVGGRPRSVRRARRRDELERRPARRDRRHRFAIERGGLGERRPARDRGRQPVRVLARATTSTSGAARATASAIAVHRLADRVARAARTASSSSTTTTASSGSRRSRRDPRCDLVSTATYLFSREHVALLERYLADGNPPDPPGRFVVWLHEREPVYGYRFAEDVARHRRPRRSCSRRTTATARARAAARAPSTRLVARTGDVRAELRHRVGTESDTDMSQVRAVPWTEWLARPPLPAALRRLWPAWARPRAPVAVRRPRRGSAAPLCGRCGAPTAWPVDRCLECSGRRLAFASARAAVAYSGAARPLVRAWKERGLRPFAAVAAELVAEVVPRPGGRRHHLYPARRRPQPEARPPAGGGARPRARRAAGTSRPTPLLERTRPVARQAGPAAASSGAGTSAARSRRPGSRERAASGGRSSTTSTRPARPPPRPRPRSARRACARCTS